MPSSSACWISVGGTPRARSSVTSSVDGRSRRAHGERRGIGSMVTGMVRPRRADGRSGTATGARSASPRGSCVDHAGSSPGTVRVVGGRVGMRLELPEQGRALAVPPDGVGEAPVRGRRVVHLPPLAEPRVGHVGAELERAVALPDEQMAHGGDDRGVGRQVVGPGPGGAGGGEELVEARSGRRSRRGRSDEGADVGGGADLAGAVEEVGHSRKGCPADRRIIVVDAGEPGDEGAHEWRHRGGSRDVSRQRPVLGQPVQRGARPVGARPGGRVGDEPARPPRQRSPSGRGRRRRPSQRDRGAGTGCWRRCRPAAVGWGPRTALPGSSARPIPRPPGRRRADRRGQRRLRRRAGAPPAGRRCGRAGRGRHRSPARQRIGPPRLARVRRRRRTPRRPRRPPRHPTARCDPASAGAPSASRPSMRTVVPSSSMAPICPSPSSVVGRRARASAKGTLVSLCTSTTSTSSPAAPRAA